MSALETLLNTYRNAAVTEREKGTYFEELIITYLRNEATYRDLYRDVWTYAEWASLQGLDKRDTGIDLVARTRGTSEFHAIQCKFYAESHRVQKGDIDSFFTASGKSAFKHRVIVSTTANWSEHAEDALQDQHPPVGKIDLNDLENSQIDWSKYQLGRAAVLQPKKMLLLHQKSALDAVVEGLGNAEHGKLIMACGTGKTFTSLEIAEKLAGAGGRVLFLVPSLALLSQTFTHELRYPATTEPARLATEMAERHDAQHMSVVFNPALQRQDHRHGHPAGRLRLHRQWQARAGLGGGASVCQNR